MTYRIFTDLGRVINDDDGQPLELLSLTAAKTVLKWYRDSSFSPKGCNYYLVDSSGKRIFGV